MGGGECVYFVLYLGICFEVLFPLILNVFVEFGLEVLGGEFFAVGADFLG